MAKRCVKIVLFFFKQKTAYEIMPSLVGSEMCIRDRGRCHPACRACATRGVVARGPACLLYTSDAADDLLCVDLGGRRFIKNKIKKKQNKKNRKYQKTQIKTTKQN